MKQSDKELLLKDLSARLPYGVKCQVDKNLLPLTLTDIDILGYGTFMTSIVAAVKIGNKAIEEIKPYLRPMSSMTEEERKELGNTIIKLELEHLPDEEGFNVKAAQSSTFEIDFYNSHHLDYRGLIPKNLAIEAEEGMYKFE